MDETIMNYISILAWIIVIGLPIYSALQLYKTMSHEQYALAKLVEPNRVKEETLKFIWKRLIIVGLALIWIIVN